MKTTTVIRNAMLALVGCLTLNAVAAEPTISDVVVRQRWPWSRLVDIDYVLTSEVGQKADVTFAGYNGTTALDIPLNAFSGDLYGVEQGFRRIVFDPAKTAYTNQPITQFRANVQAMAAPLYMIVDLTKDTGTSNQIVYLTEADLATGAYGSVQTNPINGIASIIWTGVTNDSVYATDKMVLRRVHAGTFNMGDSVPPTISTTLTKEFYAGVFEVTQRQWELITGMKPSSFNNSTYYATRPVEKVSYDDIRGATNSSPAVNWPVTDRTVVSTNSFLGKLRAKTGLADFDLPTEAQWEYLCRAGTTTYYNDGLGTPANTTSNAQMNALGRYQYNGGKVWNGSAWADPAQECGATNGTATAGTYLPNAWGLYDTHGNLWEWCLDWDAGSLAGGTDPSGAVSGSFRVLRGGCWNNAASACRSAARFCLFTPSARYNPVGFRLVRTLP